MIDIYNYYYVFYLHFQSILPILGFYQHYQLLYLIVNPELDFLKFFFIN